MRVSLCRTSRTAGKHRQQQSQSDGNTSLHLMCVQWYMHAPCIPAHLYTTHRYMSAIEVRTPTYTASTIVSNVENVKHVHRNEPILSLRLKAAFLEWSHVGWMLAGRYIGIHAYGHSLYFLSCACLLWTSHVHFQSQRLLLAATNFHIRLRLIGNDFLNRNFVPAFSYSRFQYSKTIN